MFIYRDGKEPKKGDWVQDRWGQKALVVDVQDSHVHTKRYDQDDRCMLDQIAVWEPVAFRNYRFQKIRAPKAKCCVKAAKELR